MQKEGGNATYFIVFLVLKTKHIFSHPVFVSIKKDREKEKTIFLSLW